MARPARDIGSGKRDYESADDEDESSRDESYESEGSEDDKGPQATKFFVAGTAVIVAVGLAIFWYVRQAVSSEERASPSWLRSKRFVMPLINGSNLTQSWDTELVEGMCLGREKEGLPVFDDDDEDEDDEEEFGDSYEGEGDAKPAAKTSRRLGSYIKAIVAVEGVRRFVLADGATMPYYSSADVQQEEPSGAEFVVFVFHGAVRDAINYFCAGKNLMLSQKKYPLEKSLLVVLKWHYAIDEPIPGDVWWNSSKPWGSWMAGGHSDIRSGNGAMISSFSVIDEFLVYLADNPTKYPKLKEILLMGHSAGGQTLHRYAFATHLKPPKLSTPEDVANKLGFRKDLDIRFVIANPSSYLYLDNNRWAYSCGDPDSDNPTGCTILEYKEFEFDLGRHDWSVDFEFGNEGYRVTEGLGKNNGTDYPFICRTWMYNHWFYGLNWTHLNDGFVVPYLAEHPNITEAVEIYPDRDVVYLVGQNDTCTDNEFNFCDEKCWTRNISTSLCYRNHMDMRCPAMLQGPNRNSRGFHYQRHLYEFYGRTVHGLIEVPGTGHEGGKMLTADYGLIAIEGSTKEILNMSIDPLSVPLGSVTTTTWAPGMPIR